ncbi:alpha/beta fold hydrolase [Allorhizobium taibaishanense]|uniref:Pimeloyl-ACP methyl ester carboxylesterase n=1 Tax=Allorhizobium taibaishanense TaxID=887144 RepID=A0A1Q9A9Y9_9HYPH|nr:alpha/beta fold hydrolase [Allorhizobium taibaishanense]MBB4010090.1 pimeloyl-ACP methyl ester carboxylesterase [Allorhizobium taibaishanense]OLP51693.1 hypothetical protein BJF91_16850 [Allorhizobium taibaishanense]
MFDDFEAGRLAANGIEIPYVAAGEEEPVLLLHGFLQNKALWVKIAPAFVTRGYRVICSDLRGYGQSSKPFAGADVRSPTNRIGPMNSFKAMLAWCIMRKELGTPRNAVMT